MSVYETTPTRRSRSGPSPSSRAVSGVERLARRLSDWRRARADRRGAARPDRRPAQGHRPEPRRRATERAPSRPPDRQRPPQHQRRPVPDPHRVPRPVAPGAVDGDDARRLPREDARQDRDAARRLVRRRGRGASRRSGPARMLAKTRSYGAPRSSRGWRNPAAVTQPTRIAETVRGDVLARGRGRQRIDVAGQRPRRPDPRRRHRQHAGAAADVGDPARHEARAAPAGRAPAGSPASSRGARCRRPAPPRSRARSG